MTPAQQKIKGWREKPIQFVRDNFGIEPDKWQVESLELLGDPSKQRIGLKACAGPGKTAFLAWAGWWFLSCFCAIGEHPKGAAVSITGDNLKDNLWAEFSKWRERSTWLKNAFEWTKERIFAKQHPETWFIAARSWSKKADAEAQGRTLSGLHSKFVLHLIDESGGIPLSVTRAADQALSNCQWGKIIQAGNPISRDGMLYAASTILRNVWSIVTITGDPQDANRSPRIDPAWAQQQIDLYGRDNPWVMAYILGEFPPASINVLLGPDEVEEAMGRKLNYGLFEYAQKRLGCDVAREGDDRTVLFPRQGLLASEPTEMRNLMGPEVAGRAMMLKEQWGWEVCFVDSTGGFGGSVIDSFNQGSIPNVPVNFSGKADDSSYLNRRAEMWFRMAKWVKAGGSLPKIPSLIRELTAPTYTFVNGKFALEDKQQIKKRLGYSPDLADALALTFAWAELPKGQGMGNMPSVQRNEFMTGLSLSPEEAGVGNRKRGLISDWDPMREGELVS